MQNCNTGTSLVQGTLSRFARDIWLSRLKEVAARSFLPIDLFPPPLRGNVSTRESQVGMGTCEWPVVRWRLTGLHAYSL